jgi:CHASE2 domain-containing sensor protein
MEKDTSRKKVLILAANPKDTRSLRLDQEVRDIEEGLERSQKRDQFILKPKLAVRPKDVRRALLDFDPQIIHFSGHGTEEGLVFEDDSGNSQPVSGDALAELFGLFADDDDGSIECVVLNGCYSEVQAKAIARHINYVIGMNKAIGDKAAIEFAVGFYDGLGAGISIERAYKLGCNAIHTEGIQEHLTPVLLHEKSNSVSRLQKIKRQLLRRFAWRSLRTMLLTSMGITSLVIVTRFSAVLEPVELLFFDQMIRLKSTEPKDERLLLIQIEEKDFQKFGTGTVNSLPDKVISDLLTTLIKNKPKAIGLDLYRGQAAEKGSDLERILKQTPNLYVVCKVADPKSGSQGTTPPPEARVEQIGFSDLAEDPGNVVRRQILQMGIEDIKDNQCSDGQKSMDSLSFKLAQHYLRTTGKEYKDTKDGNLASGDVVLKRLYGSTTGGYQNTARIKGYQVLLNYRSVCSNQESALADCSPRNIALEKSVQEAIEYPSNPSKKSPVFKLKENQVKDKIVLIGVKREGIDSSSPTPFSLGVEREPAMQGLIMQAQMVSQLVSAVEEGRPLLQVWSIWYEIPWILFCSLIGGILAQSFYTYRTRKLIKNVIICGLISSASLYVVCFIFFTQIMFWIPFVPAALSLLGAGGVIIFIKLKVQEFY